MKRLFAISFGWYLLYGTAYAESDFTFGVGVELLVAQNSILSQEDRDENIKKVHKIFDDVNLLWQPIGISFYPSINFRYNEDFALMDDFDGNVANSANQNMTAVGLYNDILSDFAPPTPNIPILLLTESMSRKCGTGGADNNYTPDSNYADIPHMFCGLDWAYGDTATLSHELGHFFCLPHTFTFQDLADNNPVNHDGDQIADTPPDPSFMEVDCSDEQKSDFFLNVFANGTCAPTTPRPQHEWCVTTSVPLDPTENVLQWSNGTPQDSYCTVECFASLANGDVVTSDHAPLTENNESYYGGCSGPYVLDGEPHYAFTPGQAEKVLQCLGVSDLAGLQELCVGVGDTDSDGLCDDVDPCPKVAGVATLGQDDDNDGIDDLCDPCDGFDTDQDMLCDDTDPDDDNDGCADGSDNDPLSGVMVTGYYMGDSCRGIEYGPAGANADGDQYLNCDLNEDDADDDGILDEVDFCPTSKDQDCMTRVDCPLPEVWFARCHLGDCNEFFAKLVNAVNPDPTRELIFEKIEIINQALYVKALPGKTALETAYALSGPMSLFGETQRLRLELWSYRTNAPVATIAEYLPSNAFFAPPAWGNFVEIVPSERADSLLAGATWAAGVPYGTKLLDTDLDSFPDAFDNCLAAYNPAQQDADLDGYGNSCDSDLDNDGRVSEFDEELMMLSLNTARLKVSFGSFSFVEGFWVERPLYEESSYEMTTDFFEAADLNSDQKIDVDDLLLLEEQFGENPGPSGLVHSY